MTIPFRKLSPPERARAALPVLEAARQLVVAGEEPLYAIAVAGNSGINCEFARHLLRQVAGWNLLTWQADSNVRKSDRRRAFDRAIVLARKAFGHRGGWRVSPSCP